MEMPVGRSRAETATATQGTAGSGGGWSTGAVGRWSGSALGLDYETRRRQPGRRRERHRRRRCQDEAGERVERTAHRTRVMSVVLVGLAVRVVVSTQPRQ